MNAARPPAGPTRAHPAAPTCLHIVPGLDTGGAERMLARLLRHAEGRHAVLSIRDGGRLGEEIRDTGAPLHHLGATGPWTTTLRVPAFLRRVREIGPGLLVGWMYHGNVAATLAGWHLGLPVVWNIRHSLHDLRAEKPLLRASIRLGARLSRRPRRILYNSHAAARQHREHGYAFDHAAVLPNGIDLAEFRHDAAARRAIRAQLGIADDTVVVGQVARLHAMKNHAGLIAACGRLAADGVPLALVLVGREVDDGSVRLRERIAAAGLTDGVYLLGERRDVTAVLSALDVLVSPSLWGEGFPNVVAEAMACGVPAVVTDVGDSAAVVADTGCVVRAGDTGALAAAIADLVTMAPDARLALGAAARRRVEREYDLDRVAPLYLAQFDPQARDPAREPGQSPE